MKKFLIGAAFFLAASISGYAQTSKKTTVKTKSISSTTSASFKASLQRGQLVYNTYCISCHQADGGGVPNLNAPLIKTSYVLGNKTQLVNILLKGMQGVDIDGESYSNVMPPATYLTNQQLADVLTYIRNNFGNKASAVTLAEVNAVRNKK